MSGIKFDQIITKVKTYHNHELTTLCSRDVMLDDLYRASEDVNNQLTDTVHIKMQILDSDFPGDGTHGSYALTTRNYLNEISDNLKLFNNPFNITFACSIYDVPSEVNVAGLEKILGNDNVKRVFFLDYENTIDDEKVYHWPIAIDWESSHLLKHMYKYNVLNQRKKSLTVYCDSHLSERYITYGNDRQQVYDKLYDTDMCNDHIYFLEQRRPLHVVHENYSKHAFVVSPHGFGLDCYRTWEALLCGAIVIVKTSVQDRLYDGLPVVIVDDWSECLDKRNLRRWYDQLHLLTRPRYMWEKLTYNNWLNQ